MRLKNWVKSVATIFTKQTAILPGSGLSNKILCVIAALGAVKLEDIKGPKKSSQKPNDKFVKVKV